MLVSKFTQDGDTETEVVPGILTSRPCLCQSPPPSPGFLAQLSGDPATLLPSRPADPDWASYKLGIFICLNCSGVHRNFPDISKVKSVRLDFWDDSIVKVARATRGEPWDNGAGVEAVGRVLPFDRKGN